MSGQGENRRYKRWGIFEYALITRTGTSEPEPAIVVDLSLGGFQTRSRHEYPIGEKCKVAIARELEPPIEIEAEVRYSTEIEETGLWMTGLKFLPSTLEQRVALVHYVHDRFINDLERLAI